MKICATYYRQSFYGVLYIVSDDDCFESSDVCQFGLRLHYLLYDRSYVLVSGFVAVSLAYTLSIRIADAVCAGRYLS